MSTQQTTDFSGCAPRFRKAPFAALAVLAATLAPTLLVAQGLAASPASPAATPPPKVRIAQLIEGRAIYRSNPDALPSLLREVATTTTLNLDDEPVVVHSFEDPAIFEHPFIFVNFADRAEWTFSALEIRNLRNYLDGGGFIHIDAGITAEFLRGHASFGQHHSFGEWEANPVLQDAFKAVFPEKNFRPLPRSHALFRAFHRGLPDPSLLPDTVVDYVITEKWPEGTYSAVAIQLDGRIAVLATPIISMGWARNIHGGWASNIAFRVREGAIDMEERLRNASYAGERFETVREDGRKDVIFCQEQTKPAWVAEPDGRYRVFRYYESREISDFAHTFFTRLGVNIIVHAATN